ncbi:hypothetical protein [uncultured Cocleimonas sp.]|uniref:hypothetical protein n=1 Tax=uncultured Cocleimonas sp. TaxID=1051587 RepID=UPI0026112551|nr:hypothetical protein [uncultured Cocleimonas sp.]
MNNNPYEPPQSNVSGSAGDLSIRPKSPKVIGIILLIFSILGLLSMASLIFSMFAITDETLKASMFPYGETYSLVTFVIGAISTLFAFYISILLIKYKDKGRRFFNYLMIYSVISSIISLGYILFFVLDDFTSSIAISAITSTALGLALYFVIWYIINKPKVKASLH